MCAYKPVSVILVTLLHTLFLESRRKRTRDWEADDFYDSDDDNYLDRTGTVEKKRLARMKKAGKIKDEALNYDTLVCVFVICP